MDNGVYDPWEALFEIFSKPTKLFKGCGRKYVLQFVSGQPIFERDEIDLIFETVLEEVYGAAAKIAEMKLYPRSWPAVFRTLSRPRTDAI